MGDFFGIVGVFSCSALSIGGFTGVIWLVHTVIETKGRVDRETGYRHDDLKELSDLYWKLAVRVDALEDKKPNA